LNFNVFIGADFTKPFEEDKSKQNPLHLASYAGHYDLVEYFITLQRQKSSQFVECWNINTKDEHGWTGKCALRTIL
jgi:hypothetical protein